MLEFINVSHKYEKNSVIDNFSMKIESNSVTSLLGSSGSGKTTLLRLATGLEKIQHGKIIFNGSPDYFLKIMKNKNYEFDIQNKIWVVK